MEKGTVKTTYILNIKLAKHAYSKIEHNFAGQNFKTMLQNVRLGLK